MTITPVPSLSPAQAVAARPRQAADSAGGPGAKARIMPASRIGRYGAHSRSESPASKEEERKAETPSSSTRDGCMSVLTHKLQTCCGTSSPCSCQPLSHKAEEEGVYPRVDRGTVEPDGAPAQPFPLHLPPERHVLPRASLSIAIMHALSSKPRLDAL
eukprot:768344-Hanusia_phi.AAC.14